MNADKEIRTMTREQAELLDATRVYESSQCFICGAHFTSQREEALHREESGHQPMLVRTRPRPVN